MTDEQIKAKAAAAANQAAGALAELCAVAHEGDRTLGGFGATFASENTVELLLDAAKLAIELERDAGAEPDDERNQVYGAVCRFLEGWA